MNIIDTTKHIPKTVVPERSCGTCTYCCEGWLTGTLYGYEMYPGKPCKFVNKEKGCSIYHNRPYDPCKTFKCLYRNNAAVPEELKPNLIGSVMIQRMIENIPYIEIVEGPKLLDAKIIDWILTQYRTGKIDSFRYFLNGKANYMSNNPEFIRLMDEQNQNQNI